MFRLANLIEQLQKKEKHMLDQAQSQMRNFQVYQTDLQTNRTQEEMSSKVIVLIRDCVAFLVFYRERMPSKKPSKRSKKLKIK